MSEAMEIERSTEASQLAPSICIVAGEASGDSHCAGVVKSLKELFPRASFFGMGGSRLRAEGVDIVVDAESSASVMGVTELFGSFRKIIEAFRTIEAECEKRKPDLVILVDYPDFNLRLAKKLHKPGRKILYFISPQLWAWRSGRVKTVRKYVDAVAAIFPFEERFYQQHDVRAEYVGHPFLDEPFPKKDREDFFRSIGADPDRPTVALLPGSRQSEIDRLVAPMVQGFRRLQRSRPGTQAIIPLAPSIELAAVKRFIPSGKTDIFLVDGQAREVLVNCDVAVVASGTATVEAAIAGIPMVVVYRLSELSYKIARLLVRGVRNFAMPNLIAGQKIVEELLQYEVTKERIAEELERLLGDEQYRESVKENLKKVREKLETGDSAAKRTALLASELLSELKDGERKNGARWTRRNGA